MTIPPVAVNLDEAAEALRVSRREVERMTADGRLPRVQRVGRRHLIPYAALIAFANSQPGVPPAVGQEPSPGAA